MSEKKEKKYLIDNHTLMAEWDWEKNNDLGLNPQILTLGSNIKAWWMCGKGHEWQTAIFNRNKTNCPYCSGRRVIEGENDFKTIHPELMEEWDFEKNIDVNPSKIMSSIALKVWWKCSKGHEWQARINDRHNECRGSAFLRQTQWNGVSNMCFRNSNIISRKSFVFLF